MKPQEIEFSQFVRQYKSLIYSVCMMFADAPEDTEDLVQEALINLWLGFQKNSDVTKSWVWKVTMNSCISVGRKKKKKRMECPLTVDMERLMKSSETSEKTKNVQMLYDRIHRLDLFDRALVMLWLEGMPYDEIAMILGISIKNVSVRLVRIKEQLKKMNGHGDE